MKRLQRFGGSVLRRAPIYLEVELPRECRADLVDDRELGIARPSPRWRRAESADLVCGRENQQIRSRAVGRSQVCTG